MDPMSIVNHRSLAILFCLTLVSCTSVNKAFNDPISKDLQARAGDFARVQGAWVVTYNECKGIPLPQMAGHLFIFKQDRHRLGVDPVDATERFALDETTTPKRIDFDDDKSPMIRGIYILRDDELIICSNGPGENRPTEFRTSVFASTVLTKLRRQKP